MPDDRAAASGPLLQRVFSRRGAILFTRNTIVSLFVFTLGLALLWLMVERLEVAKVPAAAISFLVSNTIHYAFGRTWIYRGTERRLAAGFAYFLINALVGLAMAMAGALFAAFLELGLHYLLARIVASIFVGLTLFLLNAVLNFRSL